MAGAGDGTGIDLALRMAGLGGDKGGGVLDGMMGKRGIEPGIEIVIGGGFLPGLGRADQHDNLTLWGAGLGKLAGKRNERAAPHRLEQLGQFARDSRRPRAKGRGGVRQHLG